MTEPARSTTDSQGLRVSGGAGGTAAHLEDLLQAGAILRSVAARLGHGGRIAIMTGAAPGVQLTGLLSPRTFAQVELALGAATIGPGGLLAVAAAAEAIGVGVQSAAQAYRAADAAVALSLRDAELLVGHIAGAAAMAAVLDPEIDLVGVVVVSVTATELRNRGRQPGPLDHLGDLTLRLLSTHAGLVERLLPIVPPMIAGAVEVLPGGRKIAAAIFGRSGGPATVADVAAGIGVLAGLAGQATGHSWLRESGVAAITVGPARATRPATGIGELVGRIPVSSAGPRVRFERIDAAGHPTCWVVSVPGTETWSPVAGRTPFDLTGNVRLMAEERSAGTVGVLAAMRAAGISRGEPVMLVGYSQGGLIAAGLAADPAVRQEFSVTHVVTAGAPIASARIPDDVSVLSIEHADDLVPRLDAAPNRDRSNWITVTGRTPVGPPPVGPIPVGPIPVGLPPVGRTPIGPTPIGQTPGVLVRSGPLAAHELDLYQRTAVQVARSTDPSIEIWRQQVAPFLDGPDKTDRTWDVELSRVVKR